MDYTINKVIRHYKPMLLKNAPFRRTTLNENTNTFDYLNNQKSSFILRNSINADGKEQKSFKPAHEAYVRRDSEILRVSHDLSNRNIINYKAAAYATATKVRIGADIQVKVGIITANSRLGQSVQGAASYAIPGDTSIIRSPGRATVYGALTPGGGGRRPSIPRPQNRGYRCPAGFQHGGRFTDNRFSTCGAQLFEIPGPLSLLAGTVRALARGSANAQDISRVVTPGESPSQSSMIQRMAQIPRSGADNPTARLNAFRESIKVLTGAPAGEGRMIRKDGVLLRPIVPSSVLRNFSGNPDMENGVFIRAIDKPEDIVGDDLALLTGPAMRQVAYVAPNGTVLTIERQRDLTVGERRKFGRQLNRAGATGDKYDVGNSIREFANNSGGAYKYSEEFPKIKNPLDVIQVTDDGKKVEVRRWVYETFIKKGKVNKKPVEKDVVREDGVEKIGTQAASVEDAVKLLNDGSSPFDIPSQYFDAAMKKSDSYKREQIGANSVRYTAKNGDSFTLSSETIENGAVAQKVYSDVAAQLGLFTPAVRVYGEPNSRSVLQADITNGGNKIDFNQSFAKVDNLDFFRVAVVDLLTDRRDRSPASLVPTTVNGKLTVVPSGNELSLMAGFKNAKDKEFAIDMSKIPGRVTELFSGKNGSLSETEKALNIKLLDDLIERAKNINWKEYISRLSSDSSLSSGEILHLSIIKDLFETRLKSLVAQKKNFLSIMGL